MRTLQDRLRPRDRSLKRLRMLVVISAVLIFVMLAAGLAFVYHDANVVRRQINRDFNRLQLLLVKQSALRIEATLSDIGLQFDRLGGEYGSQADLAAAIRLAADHTAALGVREIGLFSREGILVLRAGSEVAEPPPWAVVREMCSLRYDQPWLRSRQSDGDAEAAGSLGLLCMVRRAGPVREGIVYARLDLGRLTGETIRDIGYGQAGHGWVIDESGRFLYHPHPKYLGRHALENGPAAISSTDNSEVEGMVWRKMIEGFEGTGSYIGKPVETTADATTQLIAFAPVRSPLFADGVTWSVAISTPESDVAEAVHGATYRHLVAQAAIIGSMFLFALLVVLYERRIAKALSRRVVEQEKYLSGILQYSIDAIILLDDDNRVVVWNRGAELIFGYQEKDMVGRTLHRIIPPEMDAEAELQSIRREVLRKGYIRNHRTHRVTASGNRITVDLSRTVVRDSQGRMLGSVAIIKDVTEEQEVEQRMYNTEKLASIGTLAAGVAHEINNPLAVILGFTDLLKERFAGDSSEREDLRIIEENAEAAKKTVENLLEFAYVGERNQEHIDVNRGLETVLNIVESTLVTKNIRLVKEIEDDLPSIRGDTREFQQVIFNLINNALAAMKGEEGTLGISAWLESRRVCVRVTDTGVGIPERIQAQIFDPFFTTKKVGEGTGLGLSLSYGIVRKFGGSIDFFSHSREDDPSEPSGSAFTVTVPVDQPKTADLGRS